jgi:nitrite reductase (NADH) small subunit
MTGLDNDQLAAENWVSVGQLSDIPVLGSRRVMIGDKRIALFRTRVNKVFALLDSCPHEGGPLSDGIVHGNCVTCPLHNWVISLQDGQAQGADTGSTQTYQIRIDGEQLMLNTVQQNVIALPTTVSDTPVSATVS